MWGFGNSYPYYVNFNITNQCNSKCLSCGIWKFHLQRSREELSHVQVQNILMKLPEPLWLTLGGGEVYLREDLIEIAKSAWNCYPHLYGLGISTNGLLTDRIVNVTKDMLKQKQNLRVSVSIDGYDKLNDEIRGVSGSYTKSMNTYYQLKQLEEDHECFSTGVSYTISHYNVGKLQSFVEETGIVPDISLAHRGEPAFNNNMEMDYLVDDSQIRSVMDDLDYLLKQYKVTDPRSILKRIFIKKLKNYLKDPKKMVLPCSALSASVFIDPFGVVFPCTVWSQPLGSLLDYSFKELWKSDQAKYARELIKKEKCKICWSGCESTHTILQAMPWVLRQAI